MEPDLERDEYLGGMVGPWALWFSTLFLVIQLLQQQTTIVQDQTVTAPGPTEIASPAVQEAALLVQIVRQNSGGGGLISWDANFDNAPDDTDITPDTESIYTFVGHNGKWLFLTVNPGQPLSA